VFVRIGNKSTVKF